MEGRFRHLAADKSIHTPVGRSLDEVLRGAAAPGDALDDMITCRYRQGPSIQPIFDFPSEITQRQSLPELETAALDGRLAKLPRFGRKTSENILKSIAFLRQANTFRLSHHAAEEAEGLRSALARLPGVTAAIVAGDVRRRSEVVRDLVLVLVAEVSPAELFKRLNQLPGVHEFAGQDERRLTLRFAGGASAQIVVTTPVNVGAVLVQATGSEQHLAELASHASGRGFSLTGAALWHGSEFVPTPDEEHLYRALGLPFLAPELREGSDEVAAAARGDLPRLLELADLRGFLHCHTTYSDGSNTVEQLALACRDAGYQYVGITDHSQAAAYAGGLTPDDLLRQADEIDEVNGRLQGIRVLKGVEADILADGRVDFEDQVLARLDFVIASIHSRFNMSPPEMTARMLAAMDNPYLTIIGHPTGRLLLSRDPYGLDLDAVIEKAAASGVALEINADPHRLDLDWRVLRRARAGGAMISIGADAHSVSGIGNVEFGVGMARKGWLGPDDILNARAVEDFTARARRRR
jgi:DNA polymerase (family 10)